jgi:hypothetical protein
MVPSLWLNQILQKPRIPQIGGGKGEAVLTYREPLPTKEMRYHTAFPKGKKQSLFRLFQDSTLNGLLKFELCFLWNFGLNFRRAYHRVLSDTVKAEIYFL